MTIKLKLATLFTASLLLFGLPGCAKAQSGVDTANRAEVEQIVKSYILEHPEIIEQALDNLKEKRDRESILAVGDEIWHDKRDASYGPKNAKVTMVEFFDYNCSFCKHSSSWVRSVLDAHPKDVRVIFKELPILDRRTRTSRKAARAALAAARQGKYKEMHFALMGANGLSDAFIEKTAKQIGLDMDKFHKDMKDDDIEQHIEDNMFLATRIPGLTGTPFFVIGTDFIASGDTRALQAMLDENLKKASKG